MYSIVNNDFLLYCDSQGNRYEDEEQEQYQLPRESRMMLLLPKPQTQIQAVTTEEQQQTTLQQREVKPLKAKNDEPTQVALKALCFPLQMEKKETLSKLLKEDGFTKLSSWLSYRDLPAMQTYLHKNNGGTGAFASNGVLLMGLEEISKA